MLPVLTRAATPSRRLATAATVPRAQEAEAIPAAPIPPARPVAGSDAVASILQETLRVLARDVGGSTAWYERVAAAIVDLGSQRRARLASEFVNMIVVDTSPGT